MDSPARPPILSVVIVSWNVRDLLERCLVALRQSSFDPGSLEVLVVDNGSEDGSDALVESAFPEVRLLRMGRSGGFSEANNRGASLARGRYIALLNPDTEAAPDALPVLVRFLETHRDYGAVGPVLRLPSGRVQLEGGRRFPTLRDELLTALTFGRFEPLRRSKRSYLMPDWDHLSSRDVDVLLGACLVMPRDLYVALGGLDERYQLCGEDVDLCRRIRERGLRIRYVAETEVLHVGGASTRRAVVRSQVRSIRSIAHYYATYGSRAARVGYSIIARGLFLPKLVAISLYRCGSRSAPPGESLLGNLKACAELLRRLPRPAPKRN